MSEYLFAMQLKCLTVNLGGSDGPDPILRLNYAWLDDSKTRLDFEPVFEAGDTVHFTMSTDDDARFPLVQVDLYFTVGKPLLDGRGEAFETKSNNVTLEPNAPVDLFGPLAVAPNYPGVFRFNVWATDLAKRASEDLPSFASLDPEMIVGG